eukprot:scaffold8267_cov37-Tisochrysis_lutea.AAC.5
MYIHKWLKPRVVGNSEPFIFLGPRSLDLIYKSTSVHNVPTLEKCRATRKDWVGTIRQVFQACLADIRRRERRGATPKRARLRVYLHRHWIARTIHAWGCHVAIVGTLAGAIYIYVWRYANANAGSSSLHLPPGRLRKLHREGRGDTVR